MGFASTLLTSLILSVIQLNWEVALYSYMLWFVVPIGAIGAGMAAASGYFAGARIFHQKPAGGVLFNMIATSVSAFFLVHYIPYSQLEVEGVRVSQLVSIWEYLDISIRATSYKFVHGRTSTSELGSGGYYRALIQLVGFALGGAANFLFLKEIPYCEKCSRYLSETGRDVRDSASGEALVESYSAFAVLIADNKFAEALDYYVMNMGSPSYQPEHHLKSSVVICMCPLCGVNHLSFVMAKWKGNDWSDISETQIRNLTSERLQLKPHPPSLCGARDPARIDPN